MLAKLFEHISGCSQDAAGQLRKSPHQFSGIGSQSPLLWLVRGYAVLDGPTMPIVAESEDAEPNDTYVPQLVASGRAAVEVGPTLLTPRPVLTVFVDDLASLLSSKLPT